MAGVAVEDALGPWAALLREVKRRIRPLLTQARVAVSAGPLLGGLAGPGRRETSRMRPEAAGDSGPWRRQALLGRACRDADALRDAVRDYAVETLAAPDAVLVIDETGVPKQGKAPAAWPASTPNRPARSPTVRTGCSSGRGPWSSSTAACRSA